MTLSHFATAAALAVCPVAAAELQMTWTSTYDHVGQSVEVGRATAFTPDGGVVVTGQSHGGASDFDFATVKYSATGEQLWSRRFDGLASRIDFATQVAVDAQGNIYVAGDSYSGGSYGQGPNYDIVIIKYSPAGAILWTFTYNGPDNLDDNVYDLIVTSDALYLGGWTWSRDNLDRFSANGLTAKFDLDGSLLWQQIEKGPDNNAATVRAIDVDDGGNVYATGEMYVSYDYGETNYMTVKYDSNGARLWRQERFVSEDPSSGSGSWPLDITADSTGAVYVIGRSDYGKPQFDQGVLLKYSPSGQFLWQVDHGGSDADTFQQVMTNAAGDVFVLGTFNTEDDFVNADHMMLSYPAGGALRWKQTFAGTGGSYDGDGVAAFLPSGDIIAGVQDYDAQRHYDYHLFVYAAEDGAVLEDHALDFGGAEYLYDIAVDPQGRVAVTGRAADADVDGHSYRTAVLTPEGLGANPGDLNGDGIVNSTDLGALLGAWGPCAMVGPCAADIDGDGVVGTADLAALLGSW
ncbi:MAG: SBBP repeat-containing protein [Planctomycetota bacterium]|nr:SBBP repeat-containing protein [Planctomycetota bacterium]